MAFTPRSMETSDIDACLPLTREGFAFDPARRKELHSLWKELLETGSCITVAVEDRRLPARKRVVGFGMSVFVTDGFAGKVLAGRPFVSRAFLDEWAGGTRPYLSRKEVAAANAGEGLNLLVLHYGWDPRLSPEDRQKSQLLQTERFVHQHAGYKTKQYLHEAFGPELRDFLLAAGTGLRQDYAGRRWRAELSKVPAGDRPYLMGFDPAEALARGGTVASLFQSKAVPPRLGFSAGEQDMLGRALLGETDDRLAKSLGLSRWTVKKRWQSVYLKVKKADADLLETPGPAGGPGKERGPQRRRYLLEYLRHHPEELRPQARRPR